MKFCEEWLMDWVSSVEQYMIVLVVTLLKFENIYRRK